MSTISATVSDLLEGRPPTGGFRWPAAVPFAVPIDVLKMVNFLKLEGPRGWFASEIAYVTALVVWVYYRLYERE